MLNMSICRHVQPNETHVTSRVMPHAACRLNCMLNNCMLKHDNHDNVQCSAGLQLLLYSCYVVVAVCVVTAVDEVLIRLMLIGVVVAVGPCGLRAVDSVAPGSYCDRPRDRQ